MSVSVWAEELTLETALNRLKRVRKSGDGWRACCPAHNDRDPSLHVVEHSDKPGLPIFFCRAGCDWPSIKTALMSGLDPDIPFVVNGHKNGSVPRDRDFVPRDINTIRSSLVISKDKPPNYADNVLHYARAHGFSLGRKLSERHEYPVWATRFDIEQGTRYPAKVNAAPLPDDVNKVVRQYWNGFIQLLECRWTHTPHYGKPAPFAHPFAAAWCDVTARQAKTARDELQKSGYMVKVDNPGHRLKLWLPRTT